MSLVFAAIAPHGTLPEAPVAGAEATHASFASETPRHRTNGRVNRRDAAKARIWFFFAEF